MRKFVGISLVLFSSLVASSAMAADSGPANGISYNYVDAGFLVFDPDNASDDFTGIGLRGSFLLDRNVFLAAEYGMTSADFGFGGVDRDDMSVGVGYRMPINSKADFYGQLDYVDVSFDPGGSDDGLRLTGGLRVAMSSRFELRGALQYVDVGDSDTVLNIGAEYDFAKNVAGFFELREGDNFGGYFVGARYQF